MALALVRLTAHVRARKLDVALTRLAPGQVSCPYHFHHAAEELFYVLEGTGRMELNDEVVTVEPGTVVTIEPGTRHRLVSPGGVRTIVVGVPAFDPEDEYFD